MRIAAIDVGSNSIHLVVVETDAMGNQQVLAREKHMVRLARGVLRTGEIGAEAFQAGLEALALMAEVIRGLHCETVMACGTAALREAANAPRFIEEAEKLGIHIKVISGGRCDTSDVDGILDRLITFVAAGCRAPVHSRTKGEPA